MDRRVIARPAYNNPNGANSGDERSTPAPAAFTPTAAATRTRWRDCGSSFKTRAICCIFRKEDTIGTVSVAGCVAVDSEDNVAGDGVLSRAI
ncbi:MAG: hypothetical protein J5965_16725 [Aeriscardovia sp.]|nr:hypothetical protein [Aeriscardovia sp.]